MTFEMELRQQQRMELMVTLGAKYGMPLAVCYVSGPDTAMDDWALDLGARESEWIKEHPEKRH